MNTYCRGYLKKFKEAYFVMLHYEDGINKENMNFEELYRYYSTLHRGRNGVVAVGSSKLLELRPERF